MPQNWLKILQELEPISQSQKLDDKLYKMLRRAVDFTPETADEFKEEQELLNKILLAHLNFQKNPPYMHESYGDMFGKYLEETEQLNDRAGQFFTPMNVVKMMARIMYSITDEVQYISDPAAGCGRFMLGVAEMYQQEMGVYNFLMHNVDIDRRMYIFCTMNAILYGIPSVNIWGDSIANEYREGFMVLTGEWHYLDKETVQVFKVKFEKHKKGLEKFIEGDIVIPQGTKRKQYRNKETPTQKTLFGS